MFDRALTVSSEHHALDHRRSREAGTGDLDHAHIIDVEIDGVLGANVDAGLCYKRTQDILVAVDLAGDSATDSLLDLGAG